MRVGAMGAIGFDLPALLSIGDRQGIPEDLMLIVLPQADAGLCQAIAERHRRQAEEMRSKTSA